MSIRPQLTFDYAGSAAEKPLTHAPDGWNEQMVSWVRNKKYYGLFRSFTIPLKLIKDGALNLRKEFYNGGLDASASLAVNRYDPETDSYYIAYSGKFDFSTFKDNQNFVEIDLEDGGLSKLIKDNESVEYEIPFATTFDEPGINIFWELDHVTNPNHRFRGLQVIDFLTLLVDKMVEGKITDGTYAIASTLLGSTLFERLAITTGSAIRNNFLGAIFVSEPIPYKSTFKDFFKSLDAITPIGIGIEDRDGKETLVLESRQYFFDNATVMTLLNNVSEFELSVMKDFNFSSIKTGYPEKDYDDENYSVNEFNVEVELLAPNPSTDEVYEVRSKYRADSQGIQQIIDNTSDDVVWDDDGSDDDLFWIEIHNYVKDGAPGPVDICDMAAGLLRKKDTPAVEFDIWNAYLSPKRSLLRHRTFIESCMYGIVNKELAYVSAGKDQANNETQATQISADWVEEHSGFAINSGSSPGNQYLQPFEIKFEAPYSESLTAIVERNPRGVIAFNYNGSTFTGYILELEMKLTGRGTNTIKLLSNEVNVLTDLIRL